MVELEGDEMAQVMWVWIKEKLILPYLDIPKLQVFDLSIQNRDATDDKVTVQAAEAILKAQVGIKCATITPDLARLKEFNLKRLYVSPNGTLRRLLNGTVFREPIIVEQLPKPVPGWTKPIMIARHAYGDQYQATEALIEQSSRVELKITNAQGQEKLIPVHQFKDSPGVVMSMYNQGNSIDSFARACFRMALMRKMPLYFSTKSTILKTYDGYFQERFASIYAHEFNGLFMQAGLSYEHRLIDDMVAQAIKSQGGFLWACKNYDGDVQSDVIAQGFGSLGLMTSVLLGGPDGNTMESEAAHGTVTRHYREHQQGKATSTNPIASIYAWTRGLSHRARLDNNNALASFCSALEQACLEAINAGQMTKDLSLAMSTGKPALSTLDYINAVRACLDSRLDSALNESRS